MPFPRNIHDLGAFDSSGNAAQYVLEPIFDVIDIFGRDRVDAHHGAIKVLENEGQIEGAQRELMRQTSGVCG